MSSSKFSFTCIYGVSSPLNPSTTTVYARSAFYPSLPFTLSLQSAYYTQSAFYPWSAVRSLRFTLTEITLVILLFRHFGISCFKQAKPFTKMYKLERKVFRRLLQELPDISKETESQGSKRTPGGVTWVNVCWVCAAGLTQPLPHYSLFFGQLYTLLIIRGAILNF